MSTQLGDFINLDTSHAAKESVAIRGVGGVDSTVGGRGILIIKTTDWEGSQVWIIDPEGVYIESGDDDPAFRVLGREQWRKNGLRVVEGGSPDDHDILQDRHSGKGVSLTDCGGILAMKTLTVTDAEKEAGQTYVKNILEGTQSGMVWNLIGDNTVTTTESYCHQNQGEYHTTTDSTTILTKEYSNGFWNYELLTSEGKKAVHDKKVTHELKNSLVMNEATPLALADSSLWCRRACQDGCSKSYVERRLLLLRSSKV